MKSVVQYREIASTLKKEILSGKYAERRNFPSSVALARRFHTTRATVRRALDELNREGFVRSVNGSGTFVTKQGASRKIGLIVPGVACTEFFKPIVSEINNLARQCDYTLLFAEVYSQDRDERIHQVRELAADLIKKHVAGVIYEPLSGDSGIDANKHILDVLKKAGIPVVLLDCDIVPFPRRSNYDVVGINDVAAGAQIAEHLISSGANKIHFLVGSICPTTFVNRRYGAEDVLLRAGRLCRGGGAQCRGR